LVADSAGGDDGVLKYNESRGEEDALRCEDMPGEYFRDEELYLNGGSDPKHLDIYKLVHPT
jgi:hypothetical protein